MCGNELSCCNLLEYNNYLHIAFLTKKSSLSLILEFKFYKYKIGLKIGVYYPIELMLHFLCYQKIFWVFYLSFN